MATRPYGTAIVSFNFEPQSATPIDARLVVPTVADLTNATTFKSIDGVNYAYAGMIVAVANDGSNNALYRLNALPTTSADNWKLVGEGLLPESLPVTSSIKSVSIPTESWELDTTTNEYTYTYENSEITTSQYTIVRVEDNSKNLTTEAELSNSADLSAGKVVLRAKKVPTNTVDIKILSLNTTSTFTKAECINAIETITANSTTTFKNKTIDANNNTISNLDTTNFASGVISPLIASGQTSDLTLPTTSAVEDYVEDVAEGLQEQINQKQNTLTFDTTPIDGSTNPVTSDGIYEALRTKANLTDLVGFLKSDNIISGSNITIDELTGGNIKINASTAEVKAGENVTVEKSGLEYTISADVSEEDIKDFLKPENVVAGEHIVVEELTGGSIKISSDGGGSLSPENLIAGDNVDIEQITGGNVVISASGSLSPENLVAGTNVTIEELTGGNVKISATGGVTEIDATHVTYSNPTYPTVAAALDKLLYVALTASMSGGGTYELGTSIATVNLTWSYNKSSITSQSINQGIGTITDLTQRSYSVTGPFTSGKTWTLTASDGTTTKTASTSLSFQPKRYWGVSASTSLTNDQILALSNELSTTRSQSRTFDCSGGKYFYFVIRQDYCSGIKFTVGGLAYSGYTVTSQTVTNALGYSATYNVYRSGNIQTGSAIPVVVS